MAEITAQLAVAGLVNMAMVMTASGTFHAGHPDVASANATNSLVISQVVLSIALPLPLLIFTSRREIMGGVCEQPTDLRRRADGHDYPLAAQRFPHFANFRRHGPGLALLTGNDLILQRVCAGCARLASARPRALAGN
jgi:Mn2+/Fe2+ NRAMP family transporter